MSQSGSFITALHWETSDAEGPTRSEYQANWNAMDGHVHDNRGTGQGIRCLQTTNAPTQTGDIQINGDALQWWGATSGSVITAVNPAVAVQSLTFSGPAGVVNSRFVGIVSASGAPTTGSWLKWDYGYDEAGNIWLCTVAGAPGTWIKAGGPALPLSVANGGTGQSSLTAHTVLVGEGTGGVAQVGPGTSAYPLVSNGNADPSYQQLTGAGIAAGAITADKLSLAPQMSTTLVNTTMGGGAIWTPIITLSGLTAGDYLASGYFGFTQPNSYGSHLWQCGIGKDGGLPGPQGFIPDHNDGSDKPAFVPMGLLSGVTSSLTLYGYADGGAGVPVLNGYLTAIRVH